MTMKARTLLLASTALGFMMSSGAAHADNADKEQIRALQAQIQALTQQLGTLADKVDAQAKVPAPVKAASAQPVASEGGKEILPGVKATVGGYIEAAGIYRSKNETTDIGSNWNTAIPFDNSVNAHQSEFRGTARQSRISLLLEGKVDDAMTITGYAESDFLGAAPTANSTETNSYNPRLRIAYAGVDRSDWGLHVLAGQTWSMLTMNKAGILARQEYAPIGIDAQPTPGFTWTRNPQVRVVKDFDDKKWWVGLSAESPQANLGGITVPATVNVTNTGVSQLSTASYSTDFAPDVIAKVAYDPGWGHFETFGVMRVFHDTVLATGHSNAHIAGGGGFNALLPVIPKVLDLQGSIMYGEGLGRYGSVQLPDFAIAPNGALKPLETLTWMVGAVAHPDPTWDLYLYAGAERVGRSNQSNTNYGYGDYGLNNSTCYTTGALSATACPAQTSDVWQITPGVWKQVYKGNYGMMKVGAQYSLTRRNAFSDAQGLAPHAFENISMVSFRFYPF